MILRSHLGLRPKTPREGLDLGQEKNVWRKGGAFVGHRSQLIEKTVRFRRNLPLFGASFPAEGGSAPRSSRGAWGVAPNGYARPKQGQPIKLLNPWGEAPMRGCRGTEASVCPVGTCAKRKANRRSQPKRARREAGGLGVRKMRTPSSALWGGIARLKSEI